MYIDTRIVYEPGEGNNFFVNLGFAYNRAMKLSKDWVLFLDQDVFLINRDWYKIALNAIDQVGHEAGFITCVTNRIGNTLQIVPGIRGLPDDLTMHDTISQERWEMYGNTVEDITDKTDKLSGFFILTHKQAWKDVGGFKEGQINAFDTAYCLSVKQAGYKLYLIPGLYVYHQCWRKYPKIPASMGMIDDRLARKIKMKEDEELLKGGA